MHLIFQDDRDPIQVDEVEVVSGGWLKVFTEPDLQTNLYSPDVIDHVQGYEQEE